MLPLPLPGLLWTRPGAAAPVPPEQVESLRFLVVWAPPPTRKGPPPAAPGLGGPSVVRHPHSLLEAGEAARLVRQAGVAPPAVVPQPQRRRLVVVPTKPAKAAEPVPEGVPERPGVGASGPGPEVVVSPGFDVPLEPRPGAATVVVAGRRVDGREGVTLAPAHTRVALEEGPKAPEGLVAAPGGPSRAGLADGVVAVVEPQPSRVPRRRLRLSRGRHVVARTPGPAGDDGPNEAPVSTAYRTPTLPTHPAPNGGSGGDE